MSDRATAALAARIEQIEALRSAGGGDTAELLATAVSGHINHLWEYGGRDGASQPGRRPEWIYIRSPFVYAEPRDHRRMVVPRLIKSRGLQLRLELLLLFDAQCRYGPGQEVRNVRRINPGPDDEYMSWRQLMLASTVLTQGTGRGWGDLRARQICEALRALEAHHLVQIPREKGGNRRRYNEFRLLSEVGWPEDHEYRVPDHDRSFPLSRHFFTNLWVFALTDTELATYLVFSWLRQNMSINHATEGVFLSAHYRKELFGLTRTAWRSTRLLHQFGLIDQMPDDVRDFRTGNIVGDFKKRWADREVKPVRFKLNDKTLEQSALETIYRVLAHPTAEDELRKLDPRERLLLR